MRVQSTALSLALAACGPAGPPPAAPAPAPAAASAAPSRGDTSSPPAPDPSRPTAGRHSAHCDGSSERGERISLGIPGDPSPAVPAEVLTEVERRCDDHHPQVAGPWRHEGRTIWATLTWQAGADHVAHDPADSDAPDACLLLLDHEGSALAQGWVPPSMSARYSEAYPPTLQANPVRLPGRLPSPLVTVLAMGHGGGGGDTLELWLANDQRLALAYRFPLSGSININSWSGESATMDACRDPALFIDERHVLRAEGCYEGKTTLTCAQWTGREFVPVASPGN